MAKLKLVSIEKTYRSSEIVTALRSVSLAFRENEFVSVLGPSGCGKTTLLNIIGGLDRYDSGDLIIGSLSTQNYKATEWDTYRNRSIGFIFQNYNLIEHQSVLQNVEIAMTLSGTSKTERKRRAKEVLESVGLGDQMKKKPNQLSGGQMQRVAIARALVNNPDIILADEPTGALDSHTSIQVMNILKEISKTKLVIMVTHNNDLANEYCSRTVQLLDGEVVSDSHPLSGDEQINKKEKQAHPADKEALEKTSMSLGTAASLSWKNLLSKKGRTIITSIAGSIGIIGIALVLALSNGLTGFMDDMQTEMMAGFPITISESTQTLQNSNDMMFMMEGDNEGKFPTDNIIHRYDSSENTTVHTNALTVEYIDYVSKIQEKLPNSVNTVSYTRGVEINLLAKGEDSIVKYTTTSTSQMNSMMSMGNNLYWQEMPDNENFILSLYDLIGAYSRLPAAKNEVAIVIDEYNHLDSEFLEKLGIFSSTKEFSVTDFIDQTILKVIPNDSFYTKDTEGFFTAATAAQYDDLYYNADGVELTIVGVLRIKESVSSMGGYLSEGLIYTTALTDYIVGNAKNSEIAVAQEASDLDVIANTPFANDSAKEQKLLSLGAETKPTSISIYPTNFEGKEAVKLYLDEYNAKKADDDQIIYSDISESLGSSISSIINIISYVLIAFAAISLLVSTIMISIITYVSVIERTKEIGILRSVGARKRDISTVFITEALIIGFVAGVIGVGLSYLLSIAINVLLSGLVVVGSGGIANLNPLHAIILIGGSMALTLIAGFFPSRVAANKDPVVALRFE